MTSLEANLIEALEGLLEERRRFEGWLAQLEARRAVSPGHVVDRVRADYVARLEGVTEKLRGRAVELEGAASTLRERVAVLQGEESTRQDERAELELRSMVGEFAPEAAQEAITACEEVIGRLTAERGSLEAELARISAILTSVAQPPSVPQPSPVHEAPLTLAQPAADPLDDVAPPVPTAEPAYAPPAAHSVLSTGTLNVPSPTPAPLDELAFLQSVVDAPRDESAPIDPAAPVSASADAGADLLPPPVLSAPRRPVTPLSTAIPTTRDPFASTSAASTLTPGSIPSFLKDMPTEQVKTLKCQECGTMNYPTEWYCERCGGELAAM